MQQMTLAFEEEEPERVGVQQNEEFQTTAIGFMARMIQQVIRKQKGEIDDKRPEEFGER